MARRSTLFRYCRTGGFTLVELIMVLTIVAIISTSVAVFLNGPIRSYFLNRQRADLTAVADASLRRLSRDLRLALPNSIRMTTGGTTQYLEMLQTRTGGRYRDQTSNSGGGDPLDFTGDTAFDTLGSVASSGSSAIVVNQDQLVIYNLGFDTTDAYAGQNRSTIRTVSAGSLANESHITFDSRTFPLASPGNRFQVVSGPISFVCAPGAQNANGDGTGTLTLWRNYTIQTSQPTTMPVSASQSLMSNYVSDCQFQYEPDTTGAHQRTGLVGLRLTLTRAGESITLYGGVHVSNLP
ncbi:type II secretion system protein [Chitinimonas sp. PSY-7]|uniref:prepilin-type N-terminal cleavage/methylation domain-containing protein n=1 Tax=Chitinimonas sp. PSY-7 TaxID=3459088 RepID=UPI0040403C00